jgi:hypothetical protein
MRKSAACIFGQYDAHHRDPWRCSACGQRSGAASGDAVEDRTELVVAIADEEQSDGAFNAYVSTVAVLPALRRDRSH